MAGPTSNFLGEYVSMAVKNVVKNLDAELLSKPLFGFLKGSIGIAVGNFAKKTAKNTKKSMGKMAGPLSIALDVIGIVLQLLDALGVLEPILKIIQGVFSMIGGGIMQVLAPAIQKLTEVLFSPEMMELWLLLGHIIGAILAPIIKVFAVVLKALMPALKPLIKILGPTFALIVMVIAKAIALLILGALFPLAVAIWGIGLVIAHIIDFFTGGLANAVNNWNDFMGPIVGGMLAGGVEILTMATGGYIPPTTSGTLALIGEGGEGEWVIPESKMGGGNNDDMVWATQDNGDKLDRIINILGSQGRLR